MIETLWIQNVVHFLKKIEKNNYSWILTENAKKSNAKKLDSNALFCKCAKIFEYYYKFNYNQLEKNILKYKKKGNFFIDNPKDFKIILAETRQALSGLLNINKEIYPINLKKYYQNPDDLDNLYFNSSEQWNNPYSTGAQLSHYLFFSKMNNKNERIEHILNILKTYQKKDGWYNEKPNDTKRINGIMKIFTALDIIEYDYNNIKHLIYKIIDSILEINQEDEGCNIYDYVYVLAKSVYLDYRKNECQKKLLNIYNFILSRQHTDGGWSYFKNKTRIEMYGTKIPHGDNISDMHGTTLMCMSLWIIDHACNLNLNLNKIIS